MAMTIGKVRRDGNSLVVTIPKEEAMKARLTEGTPVQVRADETTGDVWIQAMVPRTRPDFVKLGEQVIEEKRALLDRLAKDDGEVGK